MSEEISREEIAALLARGSEEMTREEAIARIENHKIIHKMNEPRAIYISEAIDMAIKALEQESKTEQFAKWVATEIFDDMWEYNKDAFAEIACRKLERLGIVRTKGDEWELVEPQEKRCADCNHYGKLSLVCGRCDDACSMFEPQESEESDADTN